MAVSVFMYPFTVHAEDEIEKYNYELKYSIKIPAEYSQHIIDFGTGRLNIQFNKNVYLALISQDYFADLSDEEIGEYEREDFTLDEPSLDATYNDEAYITEYFTTKMNSILGKKKIESIEKETINHHEFWVCSYTIYENEIDPETEETVETMTGEGKMFFNMTEGITYYVLINCNEGPLSATPDALRTMQTFDIGRKTSPFVYVLWLGIAISIIALLVFMNNRLQLISIEVEDAEGHTTILTGDVQRAARDSEGNLIEDTVELPNIKDLVLQDEETQDADEQITQVVPIEKAQTTQTNKISLFDRITEYGDRITDRFIKRAEERKQRKAAKENADEQTTEGIPVEYDTEEQLTTNKNILDKLDQLMHEFEKEQLEKNARSEALDIPPEDETTNSDEANSNLPLIMPKEAEEEDQQPDENDKK